MRKIFLMLALAVGAITAHAQENTAVNTANKAAVSVELVTT